MIVIMPDSEVEIIRIARDIYLEDKRLGYTVASWEVREDE